MARTNVVCSYLFAHLKMKKYLICNWKSLKRQHFAAFTYGLRNDSSTEVDIHEVVFRANLKQFENFSFNVLTFLFLSNIYGNIFKLPSLASPLYTQTVD